METLLKWPGGKGREFAQVRPNIPPFTTYAEPFLGGAAFFFNLVPRRALLNDVNAKLMGLYTLVRDRSPAFEQAIHAYVDAWEGLQKTSQELQPPLLGLYQELRGNPASSHSVAACLSTYQGVFAQDFRAFFGDSEALWDAIQSSLRSKFVRLPKLELDNDVRFNDALMCDHIETAVRAGLYTYLRDAFVPCSEVEEVANFYFLREFCYGSMFRFNRDGKFNIPYGGIGYNRKDFRGKAARLFSAETRALLATAQIFNLDFRLFFEMNWDKLDEDTFCFLDPPYDTEFSAYDNLPFNRKDQEALAEIFAQLPCQAMLIIKDSEFIRGLYHRLQQVERDNSKIQIVSFDKDVWVQRAGPQ